MIMSKTCLLCSWSESR